MSYWLRRLKLFAKQLAGPRGVLIVLSVLLIAAAFLVSNTALRALLAALAVAAIGLALVMVTARERELQAEIAALREQRLISYDGSAGRYGGFPGRPTIRDDIERARALIRQSRQNLAAQPGRDVRLRTGGGSLPRTHPAVTIVVPCYDEDRFLGAALESIRRQSFSDFECIVVDDASRDGSLRIAHAFSGDDSRFSVIRHKKNAGLPAARNTGLRAARGALITFLDADDMLMADSLLDRVETLTQTNAPDVAGVYCGVRQAPESIHVDDLPSGMPWSGTVVDFITARGECPFNAHAPLVKTRVARDAGGFDESLTSGAEDWDLWQRVLRAGYVFVPSRERSAIYRQKSGSMAKSLADRHVDIATRLHGESYQYLLPERIVPTGPALLESPLPDYDRQIAVSRRSIQYAATAMMFGDRPTVDSILSKMPSLPSGILERHVQPEERARDGFRRALGLSTDEIAELANDLAPMERALLDLIPSDQTSSERLQPWRRHDVLFVPQTGESAEAMLHVAESIAGLDAAFVDVELITGEQGVGDRLRGGRFPVYSVNEWSFALAGAPVVVVMFPRDAAVEEIAAISAETGATVVALTRPEDAVLIVDDTPRYPTPVVAEPLDAATAALEDLVARSKDIAPAMRASSGWTGLAGKDPDMAYLDEEYPDTVFDALAMSRFRDIHRGERCVIIGNGPSLNALDLTKLAGEITIGVNGIFYAKDTMGFDPSYYVVEDTMVMRDNAAEIRDYRAGHKFFPSIYRETIGEAPNVTYFMMNRGYYAGGSPAFCVPRFSTDASQRMYSGQSVTIINLQLAYYMGFAEVILIGMDFSYSIPADAVVEGNHILSQGDDPNHFHPDYFGKGKVWKDPKLDRVLANYQLAKLMYEADGRRIVNASKGGKLEMFERIPYEQLFG